MDFDKGLSGRKERRLPIMVDVCLAPLERVSAEGHERTFTDNLSAQGLRVHSTRSWHPGEHAEITPVKGETPIRGEVVYCQMVDNDRFFVGFKFPSSRLPWSILHRFNGIHH
jgi:hypothetical protein